MSVTAVPLQPVKRSYIAWIWVGIAVAFAAAFLLARQGDFYTTTASGLRYHVLAAGTGPHPTDNDVALVMYEGRLPSGALFDRSDKPVPMPVKGVVPGFSEALKMMGKGGKYRFYLPAKLAYGSEEKRDEGGNVVIPANSPLIFDIQLLGSMPMQQYQQFMMQQQMMSGGGAGGPGGPGGPGGALGGPAGPGGASGGAPGEDVVPPTGK
jgi:FKBP-type peptidyl-prolyl cis-trans isomerase FkpA